MIDFQKVEVEGGKLATKGHKKTFWDNENILYLNMVKFTYYRNLSKFMELYLYT